MSACRCCSKTFSTAALLLGTDVRQSKRDPTLCWRCYSRAIDVWRGLPTPEEKKEGKP